MKDRTGRNRPHYATNLTRVGDVRGVGNMYSTVALRRGRPAARGEGTVYPTWYAAMEVAERYAAKHGGKAGAEQAD
jgi:hypothetical protein